MVLEALLQTYSRSRSGRGTVDHSICDHLCTSLYLHIIGHNDDPEHINDDALFEMAACERFDHFIPLNQITNYALHYFDIGITQQRVTYIYIILYTSHYTCYI